MGKYKWKQACKLTDKKYQTHGNTLWGKNITHEAKEKGNSLCSADVIHYYDSPIKATLFNPIGADFTNPVLWAVKAENKVADDRLKCGCKKLTTLKIIPLPKISTLQRVEFAIRLAQKIFTGYPEWQKWATGWLSGKNRTLMTAESAESAESTAARAAWRAAERAASAATAASAASAAENAAESAARAAWKAAESAASAARAAWSAAASAAESAASAASAAGKLIDKTIDEVFYKTPAQAEGKK